MFRVATRDEVDEVYNDLIGAGHKGQQAPYDAFWGARFAVIEDPDGNAVGVMSPSDPGLRHDLAPPGALPAARAWTADALKTKAGVYVISPSGKLITFIPIPEDVITNNAFGGPDMKTLYITAGKTLFRVRTDIPGLRR